MSELLLPFATRLSDGRLVAPDEVPRGLACGCVCPDCGHPLQARQGTEKAWHFAHAQASDCVNAYEKSVHELAKQIVRERKTLLLPALTVTKQALDAFRRPWSESETLFTAHVVRFDTCVASETVGDVTPDLSASAKGRRLLIELTVFHRLMPDKRERLVKTGIPSVHVDLGRFRTWQATRERLEEALFESENNRSWIWHPAEEYAHARVTARLQERLQTSHAEWEAYQAAKQARAHREPPSTPHTAEALLWRASFPPQEQRTAALRKLCTRHNVPLGKAIAVTETVKHRGELARVTPQALATEWSSALGVPLDAVYEFLRDGGYTLG